MLGQLNFLEFFYGPLLSGNTSVWVLAVELSLIGVPVFAILRFLRGTRGARLVWAVGLILVVSSLVMRLLARDFGFERISYLYPYFVLSVCLIALVVFQPELRRGLMRIGERGWWRSWGKAGQENIAPIVAAVAQLAKKKIGALIAIERTTSLGGVVESGIRLDALVSAEVIETVFWPGSALHDMGMIVHGGRIVAAGCQFPLADSEDVDRSLGSRHRAAVGMSHECDAVVVVVSEETGTISVAQHGRLRRSVSPDGLGTLLREAFSVTGPLPDGTAKSAPAAQPAKSPPPDLPLESAPTPPTPPGAVQAKQSA